MKVSPWMPDPDADYCCMRIIQGSDPTVIANRVAFIEKTPRVRVALYTGIPGRELDSRDFTNWVEGPKGCGGGSGDARADGLYGYYPPSREWCDAELQKLGYILT